MKPETLSGDRRPRPRGASSRPPAEAFVVALLLLLGLVLFPPWADSGTLIRPDVLGQMFSPHVLAALGLALVLRQGSIDLSVWVAFALGAATAARILQAGCHPLGVLAGVVGVGLILGLVHTLAVVVMRLPGWGVTLITATIGVSVVAAMTAGQVVTLTMEQLDRWPRAGQPILTTGTFCMVALLALAPLSLRSHLARKPGPGGKLAAALTASAVLSCLGGLCWLLKSGRTCMPGHLVGDLRVPAAAVLAGAAAIRAPGRSLFVCALVPLAMLAATIWWQRVWATPTWPVEANLLVLAGMAWAAHWAFLQAGRSSWSVGMLWPALAGLGIVSLGATAATDIPARDALRTALGLALWLAGVGGAVAASLIRRKRDKARPQRPPQPLEPSS